MEAQLDGPPAESPAPSTVKFAHDLNETPFKAILSESSPIEDVSKRPLALGRKARSDEGVPTRQINGVLKEPSATLEPPSDLLQDGQPSASSTAEAAGRRSVQFARSAAEDGDISAKRRSEPTVAEVESQALKDRRGASILARLRAFASSSSSTSHARSPSGYTIGGESIDQRYDFFTSETEPPTASFAESPREYQSTSGANSDADSEASVVEDINTAAAKARRRRKSRRPQDGGPQTAPTTPKTPFYRDRPNIFSFHSQSSGDRSNRPNIIQRRRSTMTDVPNADREAVSEDEGRERIAGESSWRRGNVLRGVSYNRVRKAHQRTGSEANRPSRLRRALSGAEGLGEAGEPSLWRLRGERTASLSAAKWRQIKAGLRMIGRQKKAENTVDHAKSAELLAELSAGVPAALILASMFQRDEHGNKRIPILLEQLKVKLTDSQDVVARQGDRQTSFRLELEYGNGLTRMKWTIHRSLRDFTNLHTKYKLQRQAQKIKSFRKDDTRSRLPRFPRSAFPFLRGIRGTGVSDSEDEEEQDNANEASGTEAATPKKKIIPALMRRKSSMPNAAFSGQGNESTPHSTAAVRRDQWPERQRRKLEIYLQQMIRYVMFRPESNRLCKFLELSALGVRLAAEGSYHGKEGHLIIQSGKGVDFRRAWNPSAIKDRHSSKWFLVRHSYIVCVDSPEAMNIYDVFLLDSDFRIVAKRNRVPFREQDAKSSAKSLAKTAKESAAHPQHHLLKLYNSERKLKLLAKHERQLDQFEQSIQQIISASPWAKKNRFDSFAPVRSNVFAQWLVDGRDYMWNVSRAINMAKDVIYIHDWWLSPELYMRRPAAISQKWRLDRLLQKKAREGVKIFVIVYRNINSAIPIDSEYTKFSLLDLDSNIFVQRSPNQIRQNTFFWAHHEKICVIDHMIAFVGGIDLCFGRWDTPQHEVADDKLTGFEESDVPKDADHCQLWPGKDYSNPRVQDFYALDKPYEEMYDRAKVARMPWHDIAMQIVGQPARDLTRHFVQRWNYILRQRKPTRPTPFLLPPPEFVPADLEALGLNGTCEVQILRSCGTWSIGTDRTEQSIMTAYTKMIQQSDHFIYIENQFFVSTCEIEGTRIENTIGEALVERIIRARDNDENWRAVIVIPLMPGFQNTVDAQDGTSVRLIMQCQFRSICRGETSIFGRLRAESIEPEDYIQFYSLRSWGRIGPNKALTTEQLYIHAKCMIVDDQIAIIGSANINERSMLGNRDSEVAAVVRDTDRIWSTMGGEPYQVGRFPHTLRIRLMREHLGIDVDEIMEAEQLEEEAAAQEIIEQEDIHKVEDEMAKTNDHEKYAQTLQEDVVARNEMFPSFNHDADEEQADNSNPRSGKKLTIDNRVTESNEHRKDVEGYGADHMEIPAHISNRQKTSTSQSKPASSPISARSQSPEDENKGNLNFPPSQIQRASSAELGFLNVGQLPNLPKTDDTDIGGPPLQRPNADPEHPLNPLLANMKRPHVEEDCMRDPLSDGFYNDVWHTVAENNTALFRAVFRCMPDDEVKSWKEYKEYSAYAERFAQAQGGGEGRPYIQPSRPSVSGPPGAGSNAEKLRILSMPGELAANVGEKVGDIEEKVKEKITSSKAEGEARLDGTVTDWAADATRENQARFSAVNLSLDKDKDASKHSSPTKENDPLDEKLALKKAAEKDSSQQATENSPTTRSLPPLVSDSSGLTSTSYDGALDSRPSRDHASTVASNVTTPFPALSFSDPSLPSTNPTSTQPSRHPSTHFSHLPASIQQQHTQAQQQHAQQQSQARRSRKNTTLTSASRKHAGTLGSAAGTGGGSGGGPFKASDEIMPTDEALQLLGAVQGHLIVWPYEWLAKEEAGGNWLYSIDQLAPLEIYT